MTDATDRRERSIIAAFVALSNELVDDYDVVEVLARLTRSCADLLDISSAGLLLADSSGVLHLVASSSERTHHLEVFQLQRDQGPCLDCYATGEPVVADDAEAMQRRWPEFARAAEVVGFESVHVLRETPPRTEAGSRQFLGPLLAHPAAGTERAAHTGPASGTQFRLLLRPRPLHGSRSARAGGGPSRAVARSPSHTTSRTGREGHP